MDVDGLRRREMSLLIVEKSLSFLDFATKKY